MTSNQKIISFFVKKIKKKNAITNYILLGNKITVIKSIFQSTDQSIINSS